jgi:hypothetical protein
LEERAAAGIDLVPALFGPGAAEDCVRRPQADPALSLWIGGGDRGFEASVERVEQVRAVPFGRV